MANIKPKSQQPQLGVNAGAPERPDPTDVLSQGQVHRTRTEPKGDSVAAERARDHRVDSEPDLSKHE